MKRLRSHLLLIICSWGMILLYINKGTSMTPSSNSPRCGLAAWPTSSTLGIDRQMTETYSAANGTSSLLADFKWRLEKKNHIFYIFKIYCTLSVYIGRLIFSHPIENIVWIRELDITFYFRHSILALYRSTTLSIYVEDKPGNDGV
jgi:hypothetical protein